MHDDVRMERKLDEHPDRDPSTPSEHAQAQLRPWRRPAVTRFGLVRTLSIRGSNLDGFGGSTGR
jgi:hypothetical protein